jgi:hypothetical protein
MFDTRIPTNRASRHDANTIVSTPNNSSIPLGIVSVLARTMLVYERLGRARESFPRVSRRRAASTSLSPVGVISAPVAIRPTLPAGREGSHSQRESLVVRPARGAELRAQDAWRGGRPRKTRCRGALTPRVPARGRRPRSARRQAAQRHHRPPATAFPSPNALGPETRRRCRIGPLLHPLPSQITDDRVEAHLVGGQPRERGAQDRGRIVGRPRSGRLPHRHHAARVANTSPALAIAPRASSDPSKHKRTTADGFVLAGSATLPRLTRRYGASARLIAVIVIVCEQVLFSEQPAWPLGTTSLVVATARYA